LVTLLFRFCWSTFTSYSSYLATCFNWYARTCVSDLEFYITPIIVATPLLEECEDDTHTPEMGTWESFETPETSELDCRGQNTSPWCVLHIIGKLSKCRCRKWPHMSHLHIYNISYGKKKGRESNWQFDSRPLKVGNRPDPDVCRWSVTHRWKALKENYKFALNLNPIEGLRKELWTHKVLGVQIGTISGQFRDSSLSVSGQKAIRM